MYCRNCGKELADNAKFCSKCGTKVDTAQMDEPSPPPEEPGNIQQEAGAQEPDNGKNPRKGKLWWRVVLIIVICAAAVAVCLVGWHAVRERQFRNHMDVGKAYMENAEYTEAVTEFQAAIFIDPKVVEPYIELASAFQELENTDMVEGTIDEGRTMIVDTYDRKGTLPEDSETLYYIAVEDAIENDDIDRAEEIRGEYVAMAGDAADEELPAIPEAESDSEPEPEPDTESETEQSEETSVQLSETSIQEMLALFAYWMDYQLYDWYSAEEETTAELSSYENIGMAQACAIAGRILGDQGNAEYAQDFSPASGGGYGRLTTSQLDGYLSDLFGMTYNAEEFAQHVDEIGNEVMQDENGQLYTLLGDYGAVGVTVSIEYIADTPDEDGTYKVLARYVESYDDGDIPDNIYYVQFRLKPDENSKYGCVIVGMTPAGYGEIEDAFQPQTEAENVDSDEEP